MSGQATETVTGTSTPQSSSGERRALPTRDEAIDGLVTFALALLGLIGFQHAYGGSRYLVVGLIATLVGILVAYVLSRVRIAPLLAVGVVAVVFVLFGALAFPDEAVAGLLPGPALPVALLEGMIRGWSDLVTTAAPVGTSGYLGIVPYLCGYAAGLGGMLLARKSDWPVVPAVPALLVLVASLVLGTRDAVSVLAQGALFVAVSIGWGSVRANRERRNVDGGVYWPRVITGSFMLVAVVAVALPVGANLPMADGDRYVLREEVVPPFDPRDEPSPLGAYRSYIAGDAGAEELFSVSDLPEGAHLRLATMDTYDGVVWVVGGSQESGSGRFERVGDDILPTPPGEAVRVEVEVVADRHDVWVPAVGWTRTVEYRGPRADELERSFRYNRATGTAAAPVELREGDVYGLDARLPTERDDDAAKGSSPDAGLILPPMPELPEVITEKAIEFTAGASTGYDQALELESALQQGYFSNGGPDATGTLKSSAGHSLARLERLFEEGRPIVGNAEQYAAAMAVLARSLGLPARVVIGFAPESADTVIVGDDVTAWVEIAFDGQGWIPFFPTPDEDRIPNEEPPPETRYEEVTEDEPPPREHLDVPDTIPELAPPADEDDDDSDDDSTGFVLPPWIKTILEFLLLPLLLLAAVAAAIIGAKRIRMNRRRTRGSPVDRLAGAWREVCDRGRDRGLTLPRRATRMEVADILGAPVMPFASRVDSLMFGYSEPTGEEVEGLWETMERDERAVRANETFRKRAKESLSLRSFRRRT